MATDQRDQRDQLDRQAQVVGHQPPQSIVPNAQPLARRSAGAAFSPAVVAASLGVLSLVALLFLGFRVDLVLVAGLSFLASAVLAARRFLQTSPAARAIDDAEAKLAAEASERRRYAELKQVFYRFDSPDMAVDARMAREQLEAAQSLLRTFQRAVAAKFHSGEITEARYSGTGEQVFLGIIANLRVLAGVLQNVDDLRKARGAPATQPLSADEAFTAKRAELLAANADGLAALSKANAALIEVRTERDGLRVDLETSMAEMRILAERAKLYSNDG